MQGVVENPVGELVRFSKSKYAPTGEEVKAVEPHSDPITMQQDRFCFEYACGTSGLNAVRAYVKAFPKSSEMSARVHSSELLQDARIVARVLRYLEVAGFTELAAQKKHLQLMSGAESEQVQASMVKLFYELKGKLVTKTESTHLHLNLASLLKQAKESKTESGAVIDAEIEIEGEEST